MYVEIGFPGRATAIKQSVIWKRCSAPGVGLHDSGRWSEWHQLCPKICSFVPKSIHLVARRSQIKHQRCLLTRASCRGEELCRPPSVAESPNRASNKRHSMKCVRSRERHCRLDTNVSVFKSTDSPRDKHWNLGKTCCPPTRDSTRREAKNNNFKYDKTAHARRCSRRFAEGNSCFEAAGRRTLH